MLVPRELGEILRAPEWTLRVDLGIKASAERHILHPSLMRSFQPLDWR